jgi:phosphoglycolate phosphatase-like HAD superfamily hydrolase
MRADVFVRAAERSRERLGAHASICFVGDTPEDIRAARVAGAQVIAVSTGVYQACDLAELEPDLCLSSCAELLQIATS